jgi:hypothetical protein
MSFLKNIFGNKQNTANEKNQQKADQEVELKKAIDLLSKYQKKAYLPQTQDNQNKFSSASKIGGFPYLSGYSDDVDPLFRLY